MKTQILKSPTQLQIIPESKFDDYLLKTIHKHLFNDESKWFVYWGDIDIDGDETLYEGYKISYQGGK